MLCYPGHLEVEIHVSDDDLQISANSSTVTYTETEALRQALAKLNATMQQPVLTYIGGLPGIVCLVFSVLALIQSNMLVTTAVFLLIS